MRSDKGPWNDPNILKVWWSLYIEAYVLVDVLVILLAAVLHRWLRKIIACTDGSSW